MIKEVTINFTGKSSNIPVSVELGSEIYFLDIVEYSSSRDCYIATYIRK